MCMGGGGGSSPPSQQQNQASLDIQNGVVKQGTDNYERARRASIGGIFSNGYRSPSDSLLAPAGDSTYLG